MMNIIRADIYRLTKGKGLTITLVVFVVVIVFQIVSGLNLNTGVNTGVMDAIDIKSIDLENFNLDTLGLDSFHLSDIFHSPTGSEAPLKSMEASANILFFMLPLIITIGAVDFSSGTVKNTLASSISRAKYYFAKQITSFICCVLLLLVYVLLSTLVATVVNGYGGVFDGEYSLSVLKVFLPQLWLCIAGVCVGNFFVFTLRQTTAASIIYIAFLLLPSSLILVLSLMSDWFEKLYNYELVSSIYVLTQTNSISDGNVVRILLLGTGYIIVATVGGFAIFNKAEIR